MSVDGPVVGDDLTYEPFNQSRQVRDFDCGNTDLNDFLNTEEVANYEQDGMGKTFLVYHRGTGDLVGYYTRAASGLKTEYAKRLSGSHRPAYRGKEYPATLIGRLAVQLPWQNKGIGRLVLKKIAFDAIRNGRHIGMRLLILAAERESIEFYQKFGFDFADKRGNHERDCPMMFFDLQSIEGYVGLDD